MCGDVCVWGCMCVGMCLRASFTYFGEVLRCPHKRIVTITEVYIARNNIHVEIIRFRKELAILLTFETLKWKPTTRSLLHVTSRHWCIAHRTLRNVVISGRVISGQALFGTAQLHYFKLLCTGSSYGKSVQPPNRL